VSVPKREIRARVVEGLGVEPDDVGASSLVIRVTMAALQLRRIRIAAVEPLARLTVGARFLMACKAELGLGCMRERLVTTAAFRLELGVPAYERPGHDEPLEQVLRPRS